MCICFGEIARVSSPDVGSGTASGLGETKKPGPATLKHFETSKPDKTEEGGNTGARSAWTWRGLDLPDDVVATLEPAELAT